MDVRNHLEESRMVLDVDGEEDYLKVGIENRPPLDTIELPSHISEVTIQTEWVVTAIFGADGESRRVEVHLMAGSRIPIGE